MTLNPIIALDQVIQEYGDYIRTEFRAKDSGLRRSLEAALDQPLFLAQEPFFQAHRPFKNGPCWKDLPLDPKLARVMEVRSRSHGSPSADHAFLHQSEAITLLLSDNPSPVVVTTGTGSGKTEAFLLPVIQNAIADAAAFKKNGLTAILVYPMNALANDQLERIEAYLADSGFAGTIKVAKYDRSTSQADRDELRREPPHILLTNYMMLEYLLVRPGDREGLFKNHRCRFLVLDEVHTYRGALGANIALLTRRLKAHLKSAVQDWNTDHADQARRYPALIPIGTSATIKSLAREDLPPEEKRRLRDLDVQEFFGKLTGFDPASIKVIGEEVQEISIPASARYPKPPVVDVDTGNLATPELVRKALCRLAGLPENTPLADAANGCKLIWDMNRWLIHAPMSMSEIVARVKAEAPERKDADEAAVRKEVEAALVVGAALPDGTLGALRLRAHRLIRGGWSFHRCVNPKCGKLYPMGEDRCGACGHLTAPLFLCRNCGADYLRFAGDPIDGTLHPAGEFEDQQEWMLYEPGRFEDLMDEELEEDEESPEAGAKPKRGGKKQPKQIKKLPVLRGSFDPESLAFSLVETDYSMKVILAPARTQCLSCGGRAGARNVITPVSLGTSAAVKVMTEGVVEALARAHKGMEGHDGKERVLIFSDSRQDASHQARFLIFASRYDRMRRRLLKLLEQENSLTIQRAVELLGHEGVDSKDNPHAPAGASDWLSDEDRKRVQIWEEVPLLDEISMNAGYRATLVNLGLMGVVYDRLDEYVEKLGDKLAAQLNIKKPELLHLCRCMLDLMRARGALSREILAYYPWHPAFPKHLHAAEWERRIKKPQGFPYSEGEDLPRASMGDEELESGIARHNVWRREGAGGSDPALSKIFKTLMQQFGGKVPVEQDMVDVLTFLMKPGKFIVPSKLFGRRNYQKLLQVNAENVRLVRCREDGRMKCAVCGAAFPGAQKDLPCPRCHGKLTPWLDSEVLENRTVRRIMSPEVIPLVAGEHTAQVPNDKRVELEDNFKARADQSKVNVLACSPTLEMGIDVGGLDSVVLRNVPPRPDNYAQRGGRAGRRSRVGLVLGYARRTPHDQYFYEKPAEMIAGEVPAPSLALGNRDVIMRHLNSILLSLTEPGLAGRMVDYITPMGEKKDEAVAEFVAGIKNKVGEALEVASVSFGEDVLKEANLSKEEMKEHLDGVPDRFMDVIERTQRQVVELRQALERYYHDLGDPRSATRSGELVNRVLGIQDARQGQKSEADDRSAGYPLRRLAEFGILPGYEFPSQPASIRLIGDENEDQPVTVSRPFGIGQYQPEAKVYARAKRWKVVGLDTSSPWNQRADAPGWNYRVCHECKLRYRADVPKCPRCGCDKPGMALPAYEFAGFAGSRDESPVLDEEERKYAKYLVRTYPQWNGDVIGRWTVGPGWALRLSRNEEIEWLNEGKPPTEKELEAGALVLHGEAKGYLLCGKCGHILEAPELETKAKGGRKQARQDQSRANQFNHQNSCIDAGVAPRPLAIGTNNKAEILRLLIPVPDMKSELLEELGLSLGYSLVTGMRHRYILDESEVDFLFEGPWESEEAGHKFSRISLTFIDPNIGGSGYLRRIAAEFNLVAERAIEHLQHTGCETACYRCLKSYHNQRHHSQLKWPVAVPFLEALVQDKPVKKALERGDMNDPGPWLEAYAEGVGSPLELKFLRAFEEHGFHPQKQVPVGPGDSTTAISVADFAIPEKRLAIYIDGAAFHVGGNLRRDLFIRDRLRNSDPRWEVIELRASDLSNISAILKKLGKD